MYFLWHRNVKTKKNKIFFCQNILVVSYKVKYLLTLYLDLSLLSIYLKGKHNHRKSCTWVFIAALLLIAQTRSNLNVIGCDVFYSAYSFCNKNPQTVDTHNMAKSKHPVERKKPDTTRILFIWNSTVGKMNVWT